MGILDKVTRIEKSIEKLAARRGVVRQPTEIRRAILDEIEELVEPAGRSRRVFPFNRVVVEVLAEDPKKRAALEAVLEGALGLAASIEQRLREAGCPAPSSLEVQLRFLKAAKADWEEGRSFRVLPERRERPPAAAAGEKPGPQVQAQIVVLKGTAAKRQFALTGACSNVGRLAEVLDRQGRVVRRNQVVFLDSQDEITQTVSRAQAHIQFVPPAEFRLYDDRSAYGTRILRAGRTIAIPSGSPRGVKLRTDDEIYFGQASVRFEIKRGSEA
jgi:hypothetical protein